MTALGEMYYLEGLENGARALIEALREIGISNDVTKEKLMEKFQLSAEDAEQYLAKY